MSQDLSTTTRTTLQRAGTWRSAASAPDTPSVGDALSLLATVDRPTRGGCVVVRLALDGDRLDDLQGVREWLDGEDAVVATALDRTGAPGDRAALDVLVAPGYDVETVGPALCDVAAVDAVAAATFETAAPDASRADAGDDGGDDGGTGGQGSRASESDPTAREHGDLDQAAIDEAFAELRAEVDPEPYDSLVAELDGTGLAGDDVDFGPLFEAADEGTGGTQADRREDAARPPEATGDSGHAAGRPVETDGRGEGGGAVASLGAPAASDGHPAEWMAARLDAVERRVSALEDRSTGRPHQPARGDDPDPVPARLAALEATVEDLVERQDRLRAALLGEGG